MAYWSSTIKRNLMPALNPVCLTVFFIEYYL